MGVEEDNERCWKMIRMQLLEVDRTLLEVNLTLLKMIRMQLLEDDSDVVAGR